MPSRERASGGSGLLCNIGTGTETSVNELYTAMAQNAGVNQPPITSPLGPENCNAAPSITAGLPCTWGGSLTSVNTGTAAVLEWWRANPPAD